MSQASTLPLFHLNGLPPYSHSLFLSHARIISCPFPTPDNHPHPPLQMATADESIVDKGTVTQKVEDNEVELGGQEKQGQEADTVQVRTAPTPFPMPRLPILYYCPTRGGFFPRTGSAVQGDTVSIPFLNSTPNFRTRTT